METLSDQIIGMNDTLPVDQVKKFIKSLKYEKIELRDLGLTYKQGIAVWKRMNNFIDEKAGNDLI